MSIPACGFRSQQRDDVVPVDLDADRFSTAIAVVWCGVCSSIDAKPKNSPVPARRRRPPADPRRRSSPARRRTPSRTRARRGRRSCRCAGAARSASARPARPAPPSRRRRAGRRGGLASGFRDRTPSVTSSDWPQRLNGGALSPTGRAIARAEGRADPEMGGRNTGAGRPARGWTGRRTERQGRSLVRLRRRRATRRLELHLDLAAQNRAPVLVLSNRHAAFDAHADPLLRRIAFP